jgi:hypothetical protein
MTKSGWRRIGLLLLAYSFSVYAQTAQGDIVGAVKDSSGAAVPTAEVEVINETTQAVRPVSVNSEGEFHAVGFYVGNYRVEAKAAGFKKAVVNGIRIEPAAIKRVDVALELGSVQEAIDVTSAAPVIETEGATVNSRLPSALYDKPINDVSRSGWALSAAMYAPGSSGGSGMFQLWFGATGSQTELTMDGNQQPSDFFTNPSSVEEVSVTAGAPPAEYSRSVTANVTTKSGTNELHGLYAVSLFNPATSAVRDPFTRVSSPPAGFPQWRNEVSVGGPVVIPKLYDGRNKTFWFVDFWKPRGAFTIRPANASIPTSRMMSGDFSAYPVKPKDPFTGLEFPGGIIPSNRISSVSKAAMADLYAPYRYVGDSDSFTNNAQTEGFTGGSQDSLTTKFDQNVSSSHVLNYSYYRGVRENLSSAALSAAGSGARSNFNTSRSSPLRNNRHVAGWTWTLSPSIVNQLRLGVTRYVSLREIIKDRDEPTEVLGKDVLADWGIQGITPTDDSGYPLLQIVNWNAIQSGFATASGSYDTRYQYSDNLTWVRGRHTIKFGVSGIKAMLDTNFVPGFGTFRFDGRFTGEPFADFLLGAPNTSSRTLPRATIARRIWEHGAFIQDEWRVNQRFTLSYGMRWDYFTAPIDKNNQYFTFDLQRGAIVVPNEESLKSINPAWRVDQIPVITAQQAGYPDQLTSPTGRFLPRFGFAYRPTNNPSLVVRGGYGIYQGVMRFAALQTGGPFAVTESIANATASSGAPVYGFPNPFPAVGAAGVATGSSVHPDFRPEYTQSWTMSVEKEIFKGWGVRASYIGNKGTQLAYMFDANQPVISSEAFDQSRRPYPAFQSITRIENGANSRYNALQFVVNHPFSNGLFLQVSYTAQRARNDVGEGGTSGFVRDTAPELPIDYSYDRARDSGRGQWPTHDFITNWDYYLPFGKGRRWLSGQSNVGEKVLGFFAADWSLTGVINWRSGHFFTPIYSGFDPGNVNKFTGRANVSPNCEIYTGNDLGDRQPYINLGCFSVPANGTLGNAEVNSLQTPGAFVFTLSPWKDFRLPKWEKARIRIGANIYNLTNTPAYGAYYSSLGMITSPSGSYLGGVEVRRDTETYGQRFMVFSARFIF